MRLWFVVTSALVLAFSFNTARAERPYVPLEQRLSAEQLKATGSTSSRPDSCPC